MIDSCFKELVILLYLNNDNITGGFCRIKLNGIMDSRFNQLMGSYLS